jgi:hypothetical protein
MSTLTAAQKYAVELALVSGSWSDLALTHKNCLAATGTLRAGWEFHRELVVVVEDERYNLYELLNTESVRAALALALGIPHQISVEVSLEQHPVLEEIYSVGTIVRDYCYLWAAFNRIDQFCEDCGAPVKNGRMTCLCWADEEDLKRMDRDLALHR